MKIFPVFLLLAMLSMTGCISSYIYEPASAGRVQTPVLPRPYQPDDKGHWQLSGYGIQGQEIHFAGDTAEQVDMIMGVANYVYRAELFDFFAGGHLYTGTYKHADHNIDFLPANMRFYGLGLRAGTHLNLDLGKVTFRPIGVQLLFTYEGGQFIDNLQELQAHEGTFDTTSSGVFILFENDVAVYSDHSVITLGIPFLQVGGALDADWYLSGGLGMDWTLQGNADNIGFERFRWKFFAAASYRNFSLIWNPLFGGGRYSETVNGVVRNNFRQPSELGRIGLQVEF